MSHQNWLEEPYQQRYRDEEAEEQAAQEIIEDDNWICQGNVCNPDDPCLDCINAKLVEMQDAAEDWKAEQAMSRAEDAHLDDWGD